MNKVEEIINKLKNEKLVFARVQTTNPDWLVVEIDDVEYQMEFTYSMDARKVKLVRNTLLNLLYNEKYRLHFKYSDNEDYGVILTPIECQHFNATLITEVNKMYIIDHNNKNTKYHIQACSDELEWKLRFMCIECDVVSVLKLTDRKALISPLPLTLGSVGMVNITRVEDE